MEIEEEIKRLHEAISLLKKSDSGTVKQAIREIKARIKFRKNPNRKRFQQYCSKVMENYERAGKWSSTEKMVKAIFDDMGFILGRDYWHNFKLQNEYQTGYYSLDFFFPRERIVIECDPRLWHSKMGNREKADRKRDAWLRFLGYRTYRLRSLLRNPHSLRLFLEFLFKR